jgi:hypothetical protein
MEISEMSKIIGALIALTVTVVAIAAWSKVGVVRPETAAANAMATTTAPAISSFDAMITLGKSLPLEDWRPAN